MSGTTTTTVAPRIINDADLVTALGSQPAKESELASYTTVGQLNAAVSQLNSAIAGINLTYTLQPATNTALGGVYVPTGGGLTLSNGGLAAQVVSVFGRIGNIGLTSADITAALGYTPYSAANPTGFVTATTAPVTSVNGQSGGAVTVSSSSGTYVLPAATNSTLGGVIQGAGLSITSGGTLSANVATVFGRSGAVVLQGADVTGALGYTPYNATNPTGYITASGVPVQSVAGRTGAVTLAAADVSGVAALNSPALTGTPTAPTAAAGTNNTQIATTGFVTAATTAATSTQPLILITNTYVASGTIAITDTYALINSPSACSMSLANGTVNGHPITVNNYGAGTATLTVNWQGGSSVTLAKGAVIDLFWCGSLSTYLLAS